LTPPGALATLELKMLFKSGAGLVAVVMVGCIATVRPLPVAGPTDVARGAERYPDLTAEELDTGRTLVAARCSSCHATPSPDSETPDAWPFRVNEMRARAHLDAGQHRAIERYLVTMSLAGRTLQSSSGSSR
jgi:hypothetical protein